MTSAESLVLGILKKIQAEQSTLRGRVSDVLLHLGQIESGIARIDGKESYNYAEMIQDRHRVDRLSERIERIERRLEISDA